MTNEKNGKKKSYNWTILVVEIIAEAHNIETFFLPLLKKKRGLRSEGQKQNGETHSKSKKKKEKEKRKKNIKIIGHIFQGIFIRNRLIGFHCWFGSGSRISTLSNKNETKRKKRKKKNNYVVAGTQKKRNKTNGSKQDEKKKRQFFPTSFLVFFLCKTWGCRFFCFPKGKDKKQKCHSFFESSSQTF